MPLDALNHNCVAGKVAMPHADVAPLSELDRLAREIFQAVPVEDFPQGSLQQRVCVLLQNKNRKPIVPKEEFSLNQLDSLLLEAMLKEGACDGYTTLLQFFGINLYEKVTALTSFFSEKRIKSFLANIASVFFDIYKQVPGTVEEIAHKFSDAHVRDFLIPPISSSRAVLSRLKESLIAELSSCLENQFREKQSLSLKIKEPARRQRMQASIQKQREEQEKKCLLPKKRLCASIDLLIRILGHENRDSIFLCLENFEGRNQGSVGIQDQQKILQHLQAYASFYTLIYDQFRSSEPLASSVLKERSPLIFLASLFEKMQHAPIDEESVYLVKKISAGLTEDMQILLTAAKEQNLLVLEVKAASFFHLISQIEMDFDHQIIGPSFPDFCPLRVVIQRHLINIHCCSTTIPHHVVISPSIPLVTQKLAAGVRESVLKSTTAGFATAPVLIQYEDVCDRRFQGTLTLAPGQFLSDERYTIAEQFQNYFCTLISPIESALAPLLRDLNALAPSWLSSEVSEAAAKDHEIMTDWRGLVQRVVDIPEKELARIIGEIVASSGQLIQFFQQQRHVFQLLKPAEKEAMAAEIQAIYEEKTFFLRWMMMIVEDSFRLAKGTVILNRKDAPWAASDAVMVDQLHELLRDVYSSAEEIDAAQIESMMRDNLDEQILEEWFEPSSAAVDAADEKVPEIDPEAKSENLRQNPMEVDEKASEVEPLAASKSSRVHIVSAAVSRSLNNGARPRQAIGSHSNCSVDSEMLNMIKTRQIITVLKEAGFYVARTKGPHIIMMDDFGRIVPIPKSGTQPRGTVYRMYELATAPLKRKSSKPFRR